MRRSSLDRLREDLRLQQVYNTLLRYGMDAVLERTPYVGGFRHGMQTWVWRLPKGWEEPPAAVRLRLMLEELGPTYVKIGQIVSSQASVLPADLAAELAQLQDAVRAVPRRAGARDDRRGARGAAGGAVRLVRAAAVRGGLHRAGAPRLPARRHQGGGQGAAAADHHQGPLRPRHPAERGARRRGAVGDGALARRRRHARAVLVRRARGARLPRRDLQRAPAGENMEGLPGIHVPVIYTELSTSKVITQEFVEGVKVSDVEAIEAAGLDREVDRPQRAPRAHQAAAGRRLLPRRPAPRQPPRRTSTRASSPSSTSG